MGFGMLFITNLSLMEFQVRYLTLFLFFPVIDSFKWFWMGSLHKNIELMLEFLNAGSFLGPILFLLYINDLPDGVICDIPIYADDTTLYSKCNQASDLWQQLELASELESDLQDMVDWGRKWSVDFNARKTHLVLFDQSNNTDAIDVNENGWVCS